MPDPSRQGPVYKYGWKDAGGESIQRRREVKGQGGNWLARLWPWEWRVAVGQVPPGERPLDVLMRLRLHHLRRDDLSTVGGAIPCVGLRLCKWEMRSEHSMRSRRFLACRSDMSSCFKFLLLWLPDWVELYRELGAKSALNLLSSLGPSTLTQRQGKQQRQRWLPCCVSGKGEICDLQSHSHGLLVSADLKSFAKNQMCYRESNEAMLSFHNGLSSLPPPPPAPKYQLVTFPPTWNLGRAHSEGIVCLR